MEHRAAPDVKDQLLTCMSFLAIVCTDIYLLPASLHLHGLDARQGLVLPLYALLVTGLPDAPLLLSWRELGLTHPDLPYGSESH